MKSSVRSFLSERAAAIRDSGVILLVLLITGWAGGTWSEPAWRKVRATQSQLQLHDMQGALGNGILAGVLGGFRSIVADALWLRLNLSWEDRDLPASQSLVRLVTAMDPRPLIFWLNGARMIAYDMPGWRIEAAGGYGQVSAERQRQYDLEQAAVALAYLESARQHHPNSPLVVIEGANIHLNRRKDLAAAAAAYREASQVMGAPPYAARIYAELLRKQGRVREAYDWLSIVFRSFPQADVNLYMQVLTKTSLETVSPAVQLRIMSVGILVDRIRELERELKIPEAETLSLNTP